MIIGGCINEFAKITSCECYHAGVSGEHHIDSGPLSLRYILWVHIVSCPSGIQPAFVCMDSDIVNLRGRR